MSQIKAFFHVALINDHIDITEEILYSIFKYGLIDVLDELCLCVLGEEDFEIPEKYRHKKVNIVYRSPNLAEYEYPTLKELVKFCKDNPTAKVVHLHNSGTKTGRTEEGKYIDWKYPWWRYLEVVHTLIRYERAISLLDTHDAVGIEYQATPEPHFSGSWWWANASYINTLPPVSDMEGGNQSKHRAGRLTPMHGAEFYIGCNPYMKGFSLYDSGYTWQRRLESIPTVIEHLQTLPKEEQYWLLKSEE